uniref:Uncharacterized protein n=1 Tax=Medicago truncatula TaxID=3880 RepID=A4PU23_MEDTR|nr:hypothetical protein MtrDRAFT_AC144563g41v2 [Medicago truncatula]
MDARKKNRVRCVGEHEFMSTVGEDEELEVLEKMKEEIILVPHLPAT